MRVLHKKSKNKFASLKEYYMDQKITFMCQSIGVKYHKWFIFCAVWLWKEWMWQEQTQLKVDMAT